jgi:drug/metabolite transporter (DMT)-like permease
LKPDDSPIVDERKEGWTKAAPTRFNGSSQDCLPNRIADRKPMPIHELAALGAATCWAMTGLISAGPAGHLGALAFSRTRQVFVTGLLALYVLFTGAWRDLDMASAGPLLLSGLIGIFIGDTLLFACLNRLGPRRSGILFALNAPIAAVLGWLALGETLSAVAVAGIALTAVGVFLAIVFGKRRAQMHQWEAIKGPLWVGVLFGIGAATSQAVGSIVARPVMAGGIDPFLASMLRVGIAAGCLSILIQLRIPSVKPKGPLTLKVAAVTALTGVLALAIGMTLLLFALSGGKVGIVSTLSATSPAMILPMLWLKTGERPAGGAWAGAGLVIVGMALIFIR